MEANVFFQREANVAEVNVGEVNVIARNEDWSLNSWATMAG